MPPPRIAEEKILNRISRRVNSLGAAAIIAGLLFLAVVLAAVSIAKLQKIQAAAGQRKDPRAEVLYLPSGVGLEVLSFGYGRAVSHLLWFNTISYFAKHYRGDRDYTWLSHMCSLVTRLNPQALHVFQFCGTMLAWEGNLPEQSQQILSQAIELHPENWLFYYLRGFTRIFFLDDQSGGKQDLIDSAKLPGAHPIVIRLASKKLLNMDDPETAVEFLRDALQNAADDQTRKVLKNRLKEIRYEIGFRTLEAAASRFQEQFKRPPTELADLARAGLLPEPMRLEGFADPYGGHYYIESATGQVQSTSKKRRRGLYWRKATEHEQPKP